MFGGKVLERIIFFSGGWMPSYDGVDNEEIINGGSYITEHGFGGEVYNFRNSGGRSYGYVMTQSNSLNLARINFGKKVNGDMLENVLCVFVATHPKGGRKIVGWYRNAKVYAEYQEYLGVDREIKTAYEDWNDSQVGYYAVADNKNVTLLTEEDRLGTPEFPKGKGGIGRSNVWYADSEIGYEFRQKVIDFIKEHEKKATKLAEIEYKRKRQSKVDVESKKKVEEIAIKQTIEYYADYGFSCKRVDKENLGWDLEFSKGKVKLLVEVKGLSQSYISVQLTRNEYEKMRHYKDCYRLAVVANCYEENPSINVFSYDRDKNGWFDEFRNELSIEEIVAARCELK
jgi:hypothetical protein